MSKHTFFTEYEEYQPDHRIVFGIRYVTEEEIEQEIETSPDSKIIEDTDVIDVLPDDKKPYSPENTDSDPLDKPETIDNLDGGLNPPSADPDFDPNNPDRPIIDNIDPLDIINNGENDSEDELPGSSDWIHIDRSQSDTASDPLYNYYERLVLIKKGALLRRYLNADLTCVTYKIASKWSYVDDNFYLKPSMLIDRNIRLPLSRRSYCLIKTSKGALYLVESCNVIPCYRYNIGDIVQYKNSLYKITSMNYRDMTYNLLHTEYDRDALHVKEADLKLISRTTSYHYIDLDISINPPYNLDCIRYQPISQDKYFVVIKNLVTGIIIDTSFNTNNVQVTPDFIIAGSNVLVEGRKVTIKKKGTYFFTGDGELSIEVDADDVSVCLIDVNYNSETFLTSDSNNTVVSHTGDCNILASAAFVFNGEKSYIIGDGRLTCIGSDSNVAIKAVSLEIGNEQKQTIRLFSYTSAIRAESLSVSNIYVQVTSPLVVDKLASENSTIDIKTQSFGLHVGTSTAIDKVVVQSETGITGEYLNVNKLFALSNSVPIVQGTQKLFYSFDLPILGDVVIKNPDDEVIFTFSTSKAYSELLYVSKYLVKGIYIVSVGGEEIQVEPVFDN